MEIELKAGQYLLNSETGKVKIDLGNIKRDVERYANIYLNMIDEEDCEECNDNYADIADYDDNDLLLELRCRDLPTTNLYYPHNSIRTNDAYEKLLENIERVPIEKIEQLLEEHNIF
jgi:hypothetical protein